VIWNLIQLAELGISELKEIGKYFKQIKMYLSSFLNIAEIRDFERIHFLSSIPHQEQTLSTSLVHFLDQNNFTIIEIIPNNNISSLSSKLTSNQSSFDTVKIDYNNEI
jgi:hypothetical protein